MNFSRSNFTVICSSGVAVLVIAMAIVPIYRERLGAANRLPVGSSSAEHFSVEQSQALHGPNGRVRASRTIEPSEGSPMRDLSPRLRAMIRKFESRASFMNSAFGYTVEEELEAKRSCQQMVDDLSAEEVETLIRFYRNPKSSKLPLLSNDLVHLLLYQHWGKVDGENAARTIQTWLSDHISEFGRIDDSGDPFSPSAMDPGSYTVAEVFSGWATIDEQESERALVEMLNEIRKTGVSMTDFEVSIRRRMSELARRAGEKTDVQQDGRGDGAKPLN